MSNEKLWLTEAMEKFNKKFDRHLLNIVNAPAGCGKSTFIFKDFIHNTSKYINYKHDDLIENLDRVLYVCDTTMLKDSILKSHNIYCKILEKNDLKKAIYNGNEGGIINGFKGQIKVITYSTLGWLLQNEKARYCLFWFDCIIFDELHNLFKYTKKFDSENNHVYKNVIENINNFLVNKVLLIALSATTRRIYTGIFYTFKHLEIKINTIFNTEERLYLRQYTETNKLATNNIMNELKMMVHQGTRLKEYKMLIYTKTIKQSEMYKKYLIDNGYNAEWLCSINNKTTTEDGEKIPRMTLIQQQLREKLLNDGMYPNELEVLIINGSYETGWNIYDDRVQYALIDSFDDGEQIQARNRIRHDIRELFVKVNVDNDNMIYEYNQYGDLRPTGTQCYIYRLANNLPKDYISKKLTTKDKKDLVYKYAQVWGNKTVMNWDTFKRDLDYCGYTVEINKNGTYIYKKGENKNMDNENKLIDWLENEWDKKRMALTDVRDILDLGVRTFDKLLKNETVENYMKERRYKIGIPKGTKSKYLMKY